MIWILVATMGCGALRAQSLNLISIGDFPPIPNAYLSEKIAGLDQQITILKTLGAEESNPYLVLTTEAKVKLRRIAKHLLSSVTDEPDTSMAALYGLTLVNHFNDLDRLFEAVLDQARILQVEPTDQTIQRMDVMIQALNRFVAIEYADDERLDVQDPESCEFYVYRMCSPLVPLLDPYQQKAMRTTWLSARSLSGDGASDVFPRYLTQKDVGDLIQRVAGLKGNPRSRDQMLTILGVLRTACRFPDLKPRVNMSFREMERAAEMLETLEGTNWTNHPNIPLDELLEHIFTVYMDPQKRPLAAKTLNGFVTHRAVIDGFAFLREQEVGIDPLQAVFAAAVVTTRDEFESNVGQELLDWLGTTVETLEVYHSIPKVTMSPDVRKGFVRLDEECVRLEQILLNHATRLASDPRQIHHPASSTVLGAFKRHVESLRRVSLLPIWLNRIGDFSDRPTYEVHRRFNEIVMMVGGTGSDNDRSMAEIKEFEAQMNRFSILPGEQRLRDEIAAQKLNPLGLPFDVSEALLRDIDQQRAMWVSAWAENRPPEEAGHVMRMLDRLMRWVDLGSTLSFETGDVSSLNHWNAWEVEPHAMSRWIGELKVHLTAAAQSAGQGNIGELRDLLDEIETSDSVGLLIASLYGQVGVRLHEQPDGPVSALSELLYPPDPGAYKGSYWLELATLSRYLNELSHPELIRDTAMRNQVSDLCLRIILDEPDGR